MQNLRLASWIPRWALLCVLSMPLAVHAQDDAPPGEGLRADEVLVIANRGSSASQDVARYYMGQRGIPADQLMVMDFGDYRHPNWISHDDFRRRAVLPLQQFLEQKNLRDKILCFVTCFDVPLRVEGPPSEEGDRAEIERIVGQPIRQQLQETIEQLQRADKLSEEQRQADIKRLTDVAEKRIKDQVDFVLRDSRASFDSELAWLYRADLEGVPSNDVRYKLRYASWARNAYSSATVPFRTIRQQHIQSGTTNRLYMTARLDGPTPGIAKKLVDRAMAAERDGAQGTGYFDARRPTIGLIKRGYATGEFWCRRAYIETVNAGFPAVLDEQENRFTAGQCPQALFYWGWYKLQSYEDVFDSQFPPGAIAVHTASGEATTLRANRDSGGPWCSGFLKHGATACVGPVAEPYLNAYPNAERFFPAILSGWTLGEAYWRSVDHVSWMMVLVGDPLYTPFAGKNARPNYVRGRLFFVPPGQNRPQAAPAASGRSALHVALLCQNAIFVNTPAYRVIDPGTNDQRIKLVDLDKATFQVQNDGKALVVQGIAVELDNVPAGTTQEIELHVDLGDDGGRKIVSQLFQVAG